MLKKKMIKGLNDEESPKDVLRGSLKPLKFFNYIFGDTKYFRIDFF